MAQITDRFNNIVAPLLQACVCMPDVNEGAGKNDDYKANLTELKAALDALSTALGTQIAAL